jgi:hypothetical protein
VRLDELVDRVGELAPTPVFDPVDLAALSGEERWLTLVLPGNVLALVGLDDDAVFVVTHH